MKIKLNRALWNKHKGEEMDVPETQANWAIGKGLAVLVENKAIDNSPENKMIDLNYQNKSKGGRPKKQK